jgi:hypothetical protein
VQMPLSTRSEHWYIPKIGRSGAQHGELVVPCPLTQNHSTVQYSTVQQLAKHGSGHCLQLAITGCFQYTYFIPRFVPRCTNKSNRIRPLLYDIDTSYRISLALFNAKAVKHPASASTVPDHKVRKQSNTQVLNTTKVLPCNAASPRSPHQKSCGQ